MIFDSSGEIYYYKRFQVKTLVLETPPFKSKKDTLKSIKFEMTLLRWLVSQIIEADIWKRQGS